jgi:pimeloyl-ACP methyl ester carboxylesterase
LSRSGGTATLWVRRTGANGALWVWVALTEYETDEIAMTEPLVLLPGMMCDSRIFGPQITDLSVDTPVMIAPITKGERIEEISSYVLDAMPQKFALAGLSLGAIVAMEILRRAPERVTRLALISSSPLPENPPVAAAREPLIVLAKSGRLDEAMRDTMRSEYLAPGPRRVAVLALVADMAQTLGPDVFVRQSRALQRRRDQQSTLRKCKVPTLVLCGEHDQLTPVKRHSFMSELIPYARLEVLENSGHLPTLEQPEETTRALRAWLKQPFILR